MYWEINLQKKIRRNIVVASDGLVNCNKHFFLENSFYYFVYLLVNHWDYLEAAWRPKAYPGRAVGPPWMRKVPSRPPIE